jgi:hypothetical protein
MTDADKAAYNKTDFNFELALTVMKQGKKVARRGWNGKGLFTSVQLPDENSKMGNPYLYIDAKALGGRCNPWVPSQTDLFAEDWYEVK